MCIDLNALSNTIKAISMEHFKIIFLINTFDNLKDVSTIFDNCDYINVSLEVSKKLLECDKYTDYNFDSLLENRESKIIILDDIEILFLPMLNIDIQKYFEKHSRNKVLIIKWPGKYESGELTYAKLGHPEYKRLYAKESNILTCGWT